MGEILFLGLISVIAISAIWVVVSPNLVHSAVSLLFTLFGIAGLYVFLYADFMAATQVVIYVGGILVLIIFGVMLTNKIDKPVIESVSSNKIIGVLISSFIFTMLSVVIIQNKMANQWKFFAWTFNCRINCVNIRKIFITIWTSFYFVISIISWCRIVSKKKDHIRKDQEESTELTNDKDDLDSKEILTDEDVNNSTESNDINDSDKEINKEVDKKKDEADG